MGEVWRSIGFDENVVYGQIKWVSEGIDNDMCEVLYEGGWMGGFRAHP